MKGKGVSVNGKRGDQLVTVDVHVPKKISEQQRKLIEEFDREGDVTK
jgi:DnaJ-class molecular chaperone